MPDNIRILLADDEVDITEPLREHLFIEGYDVSIAMNGKEAMTSISENKFDVVILDLFMPNIDGFDVLRSLKHNSPSTKVIILSGHAFPENITKCKELGADIILSKPSEIKEILDAIQTVIEK